MRKQCQKCPWKVGTDPYDIPNNYCEAKHASLAGTIADPGVIQVGSRIRVMACHESKGDDQIVCVGWLMNQLGPGNNIALRMAVVGGQISADVKTVGEQHERFEDTLP